MRFTVPSCALASLALLLSLSPGAGQGRCAPGLPPLIPRRVLFRDPDDPAPRLSPDGQQLAYLSSGTGARAVRVRTLGRPGERVLVRDPAGQLDSLVWQGDSEHLLYRLPASDSRRHIYQVSLPTKLVRDLTPFAGVEAQIVGIDPRVPGQLLAGMNLAGGTRADVYRIDLQTGAVTRDTANPGDVTAWFADNQLRVRGALARRANGSDELRVRSGDRSPWHPVLTGSDDLAVIRTVGFTPDNRRVWVLSNVTTETTSLLEMALDSGRRRVVARDGRYDLDGVLRQPRRRTLQAVAVAGARREWRAIDQRLPPDFAALRAVREGELAVVSRDQQDQRWVVCLTRPDSPGFYYLYDHRRRQVERLFSDRPALEPYSLAPVQPISFQARDGMTLYGYLTLPMGVPARDLPLMLLVHGGPWARDTWRYSPIVQWLANRGYAVLQINFRGSTGYGRAYLDAGNKEWGRKMRLDLLDGKRWAVAHGYARPDRVGILGGSWGGYAVLASLAFTPGEFACGVDMFGPSDLTRSFGADPHARQDEEAKRRVGDWRKDAALLRSASPLFAIGAIEAPLLIIQGGKDPIVRPAESDQVVEKLRARGREVEYLLFPDEGHGISQPADILQAVAATEAFLARHLGGRMEGATGSDGDPPGQGAYPPL